MDNQIQDATKDLTFTGERFMPEVSGQIAFEHLHRYHFAAKYCVGKQVLDVACGEGYGSHILSYAAASVAGVDISADAVAHATACYGTQKLTFIEASAALLPLADDSVDVVVSFETIEHHDQHEQMLAEIRRVLRPGGLLIISSPNKQYYSIDPGYSNPYHVKELYRHELLELIGRYFPQQQLYSQRVVYGSLLISEGSAPFSSISAEGLGTGAWEAGLSRPLYDLVLASDGELPDHSSNFYEMRVHGLDSATFYGVHLPERVHNADQDVLRLQAGHEELTKNNVVLTASNTDLSARNAELLAGAARYQERIDQLGVSIAALQAQSTDLAKITAELNHLRTQELASVRSDLRMIQAEHERAQDAARQLKATLDQQCTAKALLEAACNKQLATIERLNIEISEQQNARVGFESEVALLKSSKSWRYTAWLRRLFAIYGRRQ